jgi:hypothetical protein
MEFEAAHWQQRTDQHPDGGPTILFGIRREREKGQRRFAPTKASNAEESKGGEAQVGWGRMRCPLSRSFLPEELALR